MVEHFKLEDTTGTYVEYRFYDVLSMSRAENPSHSYREQQHRTYNKSRIKEPLPSPSPRKSKQCLLLPTGNTETTVHTPTVLELSSDSGMS